MFFDLVEGFGSDVRDLVEVVKGGEASAIGELSEAGLAVVDNGLDLSATEAGNAGEGVGGGGVGIEQERLRREGGGDGPRRRSAGGTPGDDGDVGEDDQQQDGGEGQLVASPGAVAVVGHGDSPTLAARTSARL